MGNMVMGECKNGEKKSYIAQRNCNIPKEDMEDYRSATKGSLMNSGWRPKRSFIGQINDFWTSVTNVFPQNRTFWCQKKLRVVARVTNLFCFVSGGGSTLYWLARPGNIKTKKNGNWLGPVMDLFGRLLDLSLENNAFPAALMDLFQKIPQD